MQGKALEAVSRAICPGHDAQTESAETSSSMTIIVYENERVPSMIPATVALTEGTSRVCLSRCIRSYHRVLSASTIRPKCVDESIVRQMCVPPAGKQVEHGTDSR